MIKNITMGETGWKKGAEIVSSPAQEITEGKIYNLKGWPVTKFRGKLVIFDSDLEDFENNSRQASAFLKYNSLHNALFPEDTKIRKSEDRSFLYEFN